MSYVPAGRRRSQAIGLGLSLTDITSAVESGLKYLDKAKPAMAAVKNILDDPYFPETVRLVMELREIEAAKKSGKVPPKPGQALVPSKGVPGVGLSAAVPGLKAFVYYRRHPWVLPVAIAAVIGLPFVVGYFVGKGRR